MSRESSARSHARVTFWFALVFAMLVSIPALARPMPWAEGGASNPEDLVIEIGTYGPGYEVPFWFGHTAIAVTDTRLKQRRLYDYGMFTFNAEFVPKFVRGRLEFWVGAANYERRMMYYEQADRDARMLELNLLPARRAQIAQALEEVIKPENRNYLYHHFDNNCATAIRDLIDDATDGQFEVWATRTPARHTLRGHVRRHAQWSILDFGMMFAMSGVIDRPVTAWEEMFLPTELERHIKAFKYLDDTGAHVPLFKGEKIYYAAQHRPPTPDDPGPLWPVMLAWGLLAAGVLLGLFHLHSKSEKRRFRVLAGLYLSFVGFAFGGAGSILLFMWLGTDHDATHYNENLFFVNPIWLAYLVVGLMLAFGRASAAKLMLRLAYVLGALSALGLALGLLPWFAQDSSLTLVLMIPLTIALVIAARLANKLPLLPPR